jgi:lipoprotein-anchoring transpeptidase ErfK/SrfK
VQCFLGKNSGMKGLLAAVAIGLAAGLPSSALGRPGAPACTGQVAVGSSRVAYFAAAKDRTVAYRGPGVGPFAHFRRLNVNGARTVFSVRGAVLDSRCRPTWYHVQLPIKPNGVTGYVSARSVVVGTVKTRILVDLSARRLTLYRDGRPTWRITVGVGSSKTPTPRGRFYVNQRVVARDPTGPWGPAALGISAFSPVLTDWTQGGPIAVHGTNEPGSIGRAASNGCVRVRNSTMRKLFAEVPAGTPVAIRS